MHPRTLLNLLLLTPLFISSLPADETKDATPEQLAFVRNKVLPLLEARCFECHKAGPEPKGGLRLDGRQVMLSGGDSGPVIVPGKPDESLLIEAVRYESFEMPPRTRMPPEEVDILVRWIADGAHWPAELDAAPAPSADKEFPYAERKQAHWAWQPITNPSPPDVKNTDWIRQDSDAFILNKLELAALPPAADADRYTLIRRLYFDLLGIPPGVEQVRAFVNDKRSDDEALAAVVDSLLQSPHFGERWGRHWLDLVRYAETLGHEFDYPLHNAWRYRDYVVRAFNEDVPYDQLVREHIAGDLLPQPRLHPTEQFNESIIGTGFWFLSEDKHAPVDVRAEEAARIDNQLDVFSKTFLAMTVACARCHDHKFDAISTADYYSLAGFLQSSRRQTAWLDPGRQIAARVSEIRAVKSEAAEQLHVLQQNVPDSEQLSRYMLAALDVIHGKSSPADSSAADEVVFDDFEEEQFSTWRVNGKAFAEGTAAGAFPGQNLKGLKGSRLANSWLRDDSLTGDLTSRDFVIKHPYISFLVAGGNHPGKTCINLVVDGQTVRSTTGMNSDDLRQEFWDVTELQNKTARIEIIDHHSGGWGHIDVDHIVFTSVPNNSRQHAIVSLAEKGQLDPRLLQSWVETLDNPQNAAASSLFSLPSTLAKTNNLSTFAAVAMQWANRIQQPSNTTDTQLWYDLRDGIPPNWFVQGQAFDNADSVDSRLHWHGKQIHVGQREGISSATLSRELRGTLASPTFELQHPEILVKVAGQGTRLRLVIDGYVMNEFSQLLFSGAKQDINTDGAFRWIRLAGDVHRYQGHRAHLEFLDEGNGWFCVQEIRFARKPGAAAPPDASADTNHRIAQRLTDSSAIDLAKIAQTWANIVLSEPQQATETLISSQLFPKPSTERWNAIVNRWRRSATSIPAPMPVLAMTEGTGEDERVFIRGNHRNLGEVAPRMLLTALRDGGEPMEVRGSGRRELAEKLLAADNPLLARVAVNRVWHHLFGRGIVESTDNFGVLGKLPTHPELLDHLATQFRSNGWSMKKLIRSLVLSRTYRMSSERTDLGESADPTNQLFHRTNIRRLQGEAVRDAILTVSGRLDRALGGPSIPVHLTAFMQGRGRPKQDGPLDGAGRRSIYIAVNRNFLSPFMLAFDVPAPVTTTGRRTVSNVPAQALIMLNNEFVNQQASLWAEHLLAEQPESVQELLSNAWFQLFGRPATPQELQPLLDFASAKDDLPNQNQTAEICHVLLNSKEFLFLR